MKTLIIKAPTQSLRRRISPFPIPPPICPPPPPLPLSPKPLPPRPPRTPLNPVRRIIKVNNRIRRLSGALLPQRDLLMWLLGLAPFL